MSPSHLLYKGCLSGVQELLAEWHSCLTEPVAISRNLWSALLQLNLQEELSYPAESSSHYRYVHFHLKKVLLCFQLMGLSLLFWGQWTSVEARTGLSGYISSSALNVRVCRGIAFKVQSIWQRQYIIYCSIAAISTAFFYLIRALSCLTFEPILDPSLVECPSHYWLALLAGGPKHGCRFT